jgi:RimJ/RimL family protein N-acetyltransferase
MTQIIETSRLILREFEIDDAENMFLLNSNPEVIKYTGDLAFVSISDAKTFLMQYDDYQMNGFGRWSVIVKDSNKFIGWCGLKLNEENFVDIGFRFFKREWHKGYATESAKACLNYGFNKLKISEIIGRVAKENKASIRVLGKLGMIFWKLDNCKGIENSIYYKLNKSQFNTLSD